jgi:hypothetical protein
LRILSGWRGLTAPCDRGHMEILIQVLDDLDDLWQRLPHVLRSSHARTAIFGTCCVAALGLGTLSFVVH